MLCFDPRDPFPYPISADYAAEKAHSELVDEWLGLRIVSAEARILDRKDGAQRWMHVPPSTFLTPYTELRRIIEICRPEEQSLVVDLGAGYGRLGFVLERHSKARFLGLELVEERVAEGQQALLRFGAARSELRAFDLSKMPAPEADLYFVYDYGTRQAIEHTLGELRADSLNRRIRVVGRGRAVRDAIERKHPWLSEVVAPEHHGNFSVYSSAER